jgi:hypothetical protein
VLDSLGRLFKRCLWSAASETLQHSEGYGRDLDCQKMGTNLLNGSSPKPSDAYLHDVRRQLLKAGKLSLKSG